VLLTVDIGNTNLVCGLFEEAHLSQTFRLETVRSRTVDEYAALLSQLLALRGVDPQKIDACIIASVVPPSTEVVKRAIEQVVSIVPLVVGGPGLRTGIRIRYDNPREVGADRIVNAIAAHARCEGAVIVVDFGTATTFDCVSQEGDYIGGVIVPGVQVSLDGLLVRAAKLSRVDLSPPPHVIGKNTVHAMQSGILYGYASMVDGLLKKIESEMGGPCRTLATGGLAETICAFTTGVEEVIPDLTLEGLRLIYELNRGASPR
jgi:type III pantothenate kinase